MQELKKTKEEDQLERKLKCLNGELVPLKCTKQCFESHIESLEKDADNCRKNWKRTKFHVDYQIQQLEKFYERKGKRIKRNFCFGERLNTGFGKSI